MKWWAKSFRFGKPKKDSDKQIWWVCQPLRILSWEFKLVQVYIGLSLFTLWLSKTFMLPSQPFTKLKFVVTWPPKLSCASNSWLVFSSSSIISLWWYSPKFWLAFQILLILHHLMEMSGPTLLRIPLFPCPTLSGSRVVRRRETLGTRFTHSMH